MSEKISFNQVNKQETSAYMNQSGEMPTILVPRSDGSIQPGYLDKGASKIYLSKDKNGHPDTEGSYKVIKSPEAVSDGVQEKLATQLAGIALRSEVNTEVGPQTDEIADPFELLQDSVQAEVNRYREALQHKQESELAKDFAQAADDKRYIYRVTQTLSPEAKKFLNL